MDKSALIGLVNDQLREIGVPEDALLPTDAEISVKRQTQMLEDKYLGTLVTTEYLPFVFHQLDHLTEGKELPARYNKVLKANDIYTIKGSIANYKQALHEWTRAPVIMELDSAYNGPRPAIAGIRDKAKNLPLAKMTRAFDQGETHLNAVLRTLHWEYLSSLAVQAAWLNVSLDPELARPLAWDMAKLTLAITLVSDDECETDLEIAALEIAFLSGRLLPLGLYALFQPDGSDSTPYNTLKAALLGTLLECGILGKFGADLPKRPVEKPDDLVYKRFTCGSVESPDVFSDNALFKDQCVKTVKHFIGNIGPHRAATLNGMTIEVMLLANLLEEASKIPEFTMNGALQLGTRIEPQFRDLAETINMFLDQHGDMRETTFDLSQWDRLLDVLMDHPEQMAILADPIRKLEKQLDESRPLMDNIPWRQRTNRCKPLFSALTHALDMAEPVIEKHQALSDTEEAVQLAVSEKKYDLLGILGQKADAAKSQLAQAVLGYGEHVLNVQIALNDLLDSFIEEDEADSVEPAPEQAEKIGELEMVVDEQEKELVQLRQRLSKAESREPEAVAVHKLDAEVLPTVAGLCRTAGDAIEAAKGLFSHLNFDNLGMAKRSNIPRLKLLQMLEKLNTYAVTGHNSVFSANQWALSEGDGVLASHRDALTIKVDGKKVLADAHVRLDKSNRIYFARLGETVYIGLITKHL